MDAPDPDAPLRIAYLTYRGKPHVGGQGVYSRHLTKALVDLGHHVEVYAGPPYPIIDERIPFHPLPSLDIWADPHPMRKPRLWEWKDWTDALEHLSFATGTFSEPMAFSWRVWRELRTRRNDFDLIQDNQTLGWGILKLHREQWPILERSPPDHGRPQTRTRTRPHPVGKFGKRRWYAFTKMQTRVAQRMPRILSVSENSKQDISADKGVDLDKIHVVPVGVDPDLFLPVPGVERRPGHIVTTASADVAMKGLKFLLEAVAKLRTERHMELTIIGKRRLIPRQPDDDRPRSRRLRELRQRRPRRTHR